MAVLAAGWIAVTLQWILHRRGYKTAADGKRRDPRSLYGLALQFVAVFVCYFGKMTASLDLATGKSLIEAGIVTLFVAAALLFNKSALKALGADFSVVAQTREEGTLATKGPYALSAIRFTSATCC